MGATRIIRSDIWLVGQACYGTGIGPVVSPTILDGNWRWYARDFLMPAGVEFASITLELWNGVPSGRQADFDTLQFSLGGCPSRGAPIPEGFRVFVEFLDRYAPVQD